MARSPTVWEPLEESLLRSGLRSDGSEHRLKGGGVALQGFTGGGRTIIVCQMGIGIAWPGYAERRQLRNRIRRSTFRSDRWLSNATAGDWRGGDHPKSRQVLFTDASRSLRLLTWRQASESGLLRYVEVPLDDGYDRGSALREPIPMEQLRPGSRPSAATRTRLPRVVEEFLVAGLARPARALAEENVAEWCRDRAEPRLLQPVWNALWSVRVVDPACGDGTWLVKMGLALERIGIAITDRARSAVDDMGREVNAVDGKLFDLVRSVERLGDPESSEAYIRSRIVAEDLFGWASRRDHVRRTRARLLDHTSVDRNSGDLLTNVRLCMKEPASGGPRRQRLPSFEHPGAELRTEKDLHEEERILHLSRCAALADFAEAGGLAQTDRWRFRREWDRRRRALIRLSADLRQSPTGGMNATKDVQLLRIGLWAKDDLCFVRRTT